MAYKYNPNDPHYNLYSKHLGLFVENEIRLLVNLSDIYPSILEYEGSDKEKGSILTLQATPASVYVQECQTVYFVVKNDGSNFIEGVHFEFI